MLQVFPYNAVNVRLRVKLLNSASPSGAGLTGLTHTSAGLIISTIGSTEATVTAYTQAANTIEGISTLGTFAAPTATKCRFKEIDAVNMPGWYEIQLADSRWAQPSDSTSLALSIHGATNLQQADYLVQLQVDNPFISKPTNFDTLTIFSGGVDVVRIDGEALPVTRLKEFTGRFILASDEVWDTVTPTTAKLYGSNTDIDDIYKDCLLVLASGDDTKHQSRWITAYDSATQTVTVDRPWDDPPIEFDYYQILGIRRSAVGVIRQGTCQTDGSPDSTHAVLDAGASAINDYYNGLWLKIVAGTGLGQEPRAITDYVGSTKRVTLDPPLTTNADNTTEFAIFG